MPYWQAAATVAASAYSANQGAAAASGSNRAARVAAWKNRRWQRNMSNTAVQRSVRDMRKAGINPILATSPGGGASTPGGATAQVFDQAAAESGRMAATGQFAGSVVGAIKTIQEQKQIAAATVKIIGETSYGQQAINQLGGVAKLRQFLFENPTVNEDVQELLDSVKGGILPDSLVDKFKELITGHSTSTNGIGISSGGRKSWDYREYFENRSGKW